MTFQLPLRQTNRLLAHARHAQETYSDLDPNEAFNEYVKNTELPGFMFLDSAGRRVCWEPDVHYYQSWTEKFESFYEHDQQGQYHLPRCRKQLLAEIDKPKAADKTALVAHPSESGWDLPTEHKRHYLKFPMEIRLLIAGFVLTVPSPEVVVPDVVHCCRKSCRTVPSFYVRDDPRDYAVTGRPLIKQTQKFDEDGEYTLLRKVYFKAIDASFLRVCKQLYNEGIDVLYGQNNFAFDTADEHYHNGRGWSSIDDRPGGTGLVIRKPAMSDIEAVTRANFHIMYRDPCKDLPCWLCYDTFLRFLWCIGPENPASLESPTFSGHVKTHDCSPVTCRARVCEDFVQSMDFYKPFINKFCPNLKHLTIEATTDKFGSGLVFSSWSGDLARRDKALLPLLEGSIRSIQSLEKLDVTDEHKQPLSIADPTIRWIGIVPMSDYVW